MSLYVPSGAPALKAPRSYGSKPITAQSYEGHTTVTGTPSPDNPATLTPVEPPAVPDAARQIGPLWSLPDGTKDTYDGETGELVRKIYKIVLNGTENWSASKLETGVYDFKLEGYPFVVGQMDNAIGTNVLSSHFIIAQGLLLDKSSYGQKTEIHLYFTEITTVDGIKAWLSAQAAAGTPVTVLYELAQPTVDHLIYTGPIATRATDILAPSWTGKTTMIGEPSPDNPATISGVPFQATATGPDGQTRSVDLGFTGYSLPDGTRDTYDGGRGDFVQRVGKLVLDGTENWRFDSRAFWTTVSTAKACIPLCTTFAGVESSSTMPDNSITINIKQRIYIIYNVMAGNVDNFKAWLATQAAAGTPITIYCALADPIAYNKKVDITAFDGEITVTGADVVEVIEGRVLRVADCLPFEIVRSNRNLFDNWYFPRPINQRGITSGALWGEYAYGIDRIIAFEGGVTKWVQDEGVWLMPGTGSILEERFEQNRITKNQIATFSALVNNQIASITFDLHNPGYASYEKEIGVENNRIKLEIQKYRPGNGICTARVWNLRNGPATLVTAIKLEEGHTQTLARKIGDQWVLNDPPPDPALELLKCQRYLVSYKSTDVQNSSVFFGTGVLDGVNQNGHTIGQGFIVLPCTMRTKPIITGSVNVYNSRVNAPINVVDIQGVSGNIMRLNFAVLHELPLDERMCLLWGSGDVLIGAEL